MNLKPLFEKQKQLMDRIEKEHPAKEGENRFDKRVLSLLVEIGECANEWRGFKFWSKDQEPRTKVPVTAWGKPYKNPLLEEYVDGLHFLIEIAIELKVSADSIEIFEGSIRKKIGSMEYHFGYLYHSISGLMNTSIHHDRQFKILHIFMAYSGLGYRLGFTWEQIEQAYYEKNKVNHERQDNGY